MYDATPMYRITEDVVWYAYRGNPDVRGRLGLDCVSTGYAAD